VRYGTASSIGCAAVAIALGLWPVGVAEAAPRRPPREAEAVGTREADWVQVVSGEWLRGSIQRLHDGELAFSSDELDDVVLDWNAVESLVPRDVVTVRLEGRRIATGTFVMWAGAISLETAGATLSPARDEVVELMPGRPTEANFWSGGLHVGLSAREGNTEQLDLTLQAELMRHTPLTRFRADYTGQLSTADGARSANSHRVPASFDLFVTRRTFVTLPSFEFFTDEFQNIDTRLSTGAGIGTELLDRGVLRWEVDTGASHVHTRYESVGEGDEVAEDDVGVGLSTSIELDLPRDIEWNNLYRLQIVVTDLDKTNHHGESSLEIAVWGPLELDVTFIFDRIERPRSFDGGEQPESNDYRLTAGLGLEF